MHRALSQRVLSVATVVCRRLSDQQGDCAVLSFCVEDVGNAVVLAVDQKLELPNPAALLAWRSALWLSSVSPTFGDIRDHRD